MMRRVCIVGGGPSGLYTAKYLLEKHPATSVDVLDASPLPFGLVRNGVAPDHPEVKLVTHTFDAMADQHSDRFRFVGNVRLSPSPSQDPGAHQPLDVDIDTLASSYDAVVLATGAPSSRPLSIPNEDALSHVLPARAFVEWYNGALDAPDLAPLLTNENTLPKTVSVVGAGNVALDVARMLASPPSVLAATDMPSRVVDVLAEIQDALSIVRIVARRGPQHAAFTTKEVRELTKLPHVDVHATGVPDQEWDPKHPDVAPALKGNRVATRVFRLLSTAFDHSPPTPRASNADPLPLELAFYASPHSLLPSPDSPSRVGSLRVTQMMRHPDSPQKAIPRPDAPLLDLQSDLVLPSVGYASTPLPGVPFDPQTCTIPNVSGRVLDTPLPLYCAGWAKRGPRGVIVATLNDAVETASTLLHDLESLPHNASQSTDLPSLLGTDKATFASSTTSYSDWLFIDDWEQRTGQSSGQSRTKVESAQQVFDLLSETSERTSAASV